MINKQIPKIQIFVSHRIDNAFVVVSNPEYVAVRCGAVFDKRENIKMLGDNIGKNISNKRNSFCELTILYWAWKNCKNLDYIGLCHYRRYFAFNETADKNIFITDFLKRELTIPKDLLKNYDIILPKKFVLTKSIKEHYCTDHIANDWDTLTEIIKRKYPDYSVYLEKVFDQNEIYLYNMFILSKENFDKYMEWLFDILFEVEKNIKLSNDPYQQRVFGFMGERLLNLYVIANHFKVKEVPIYMIYDRRLQYYTTNIKKFFKEKFPFLIKVKKNIKIIFEYIKKKA